MLEINDVFLKVPSPEGERELLSNVSARFPLGHFGAIIGPSGCGKTTLLKLVAGIVDGDEEGTVFWKGRNLEKEDFLSTEISYVPQFSIAHEELTVRECVEFAMRLRVRNAEGVDRASAVDQLLSEVRMEEFADQRVQVLSGGQRRRLALAMEMTSQPEILLCDEVTSGLDPRSEDEIVKLLHNLSRRKNRLVLSVTHSLEHLNLYDSVLVLYRGIVAYQGPPAFLAHYFSVDSPNKLYERLELREPADWAASWKKHQEAIQKAAEPAKNAPAEESPEKPAPPVELPGASSQFLALLERRMLIFTRSRAQIFLQLGLILGFPLLVAVFAWNGLPAVMNLSMGLDLDLARQLSEARDFLIQSSKVGSLVSGIVMFQVILLTLMGANNSGREIAAERRIFEKEKLSGLNTSAYVASKAAFLLGLVLAQSIWMGIFVHHVCGFPGDFVTQLLLLVLVNAAMTSVCLGVSSLMSSAEQASLVSIYLVGFQLPLSGAVLALPALLGDAVRPFISAYWSWSGILQTLKSERYYDIVQTVVQSPLSPLSLCLWVLLAHVAAGLFVTCIGCERRHLV
ncbi:MAG: ATP-binding cassette domain-containing protein [Verrucomicrobia bacterium]|nr:ATP-binding cassette domain-containing protein [Verrucomicrobiota bacterium]